MMILKLQTDATNSTLLVYNESRDFLVEDDSEVALQTIEDYGLLPLSKAFVEGTYDANTGQLTLGDRVQQEDW